MPHLPVHLMFSMIAVLMRQGLCEVGGHGSLASPNKCQLPERSQRSRCNTDVMIHQLWRGLRMSRTACVCAGYNMVIWSSTAWSSAHLQHGHLFIYSMVISSSTAWSSVHLQHGHLFIYSMVFCSSTTWSSVHLHHGHLFTEG